MNKFAYLAIFAGVACAAPAVSAGCTQTTIVEQVEPGPAPTDTPTGDAGTEASTSGQKVDGPSGTLFGATVKSYATLGAGGEIATAGVIVPFAAFNAAPANGPFQDEMVLEMPDAVKSQTFLQHLRVNWLSKGHGPSPYSAPHFDLHFYRGTVAEIDAIDCRADKRLPPAAQVPAGYTMEPQLCASAMGFHSWPEKDLSSSAWSGSMILGYFAEKMVFLEPMIPKTTIAAKQSFGFEVAKPSTLGGAKTLYPRQMNATYDATAETDVRAFELPTDTLLELMEEHPELLRATIRYLGERMYYDLQEMPAEALGLPFQEAPPVPDRPLDIVERVMVLRRGSAFTTASVNALTVMAKQLEELRLEPGVRLWRRGDPADHMFLVVSGAVTCTAEDGRTFRYGPGTAVGGLEALADKTRWYEPVTEVHTVGLRGRSDHLMDLFENYFSMAMDFVSSLARAQIGILARRTALGQRPLAVARDVSNLGAVKVGA